MIKFPKKVWLSLWLILFVFACKSTENKNKSSLVGTSTSEEQNKIAQVQNEPIFTKLLDEVQVDTTEQDNTNAQPLWLTPKGSYNPERTKKFRLIHTKLQVSFDWEKQYLNGIATLTLSPYFYPQDSVELDAKGFDIHKVELVENKSSQGLKYNYNAKKLKIGLGRKYEKSEKLYLKITYTAKPNELEVKGSAAITSDKGLYFINPLGKDKYKPQQIWTQGETEANSCWFPTFDAPNVKTTQEMFITVDKQFVTLSNGKLLDTKNNSDGTRTDHWLQDKPHAPYLFMMAIGKYAIVKDKWRDVELSYYVEPAYQQYAKAVFGNTPEMMEFFSKILDYPYVWDKYAQVVVRDYVSGAMENTTATIFNESLQVDNRYMIDDNHDNIIAHELFHHWFGDLVTTESWANLPLNESFATYAEYLWNEYKYGQGDAAAWWSDALSQYLSEADSKREPLIRYYYLDKEDMFDSHSYAKGGLILHSLRKLAGDEAFFASLNLYLKKNQYQTAEIHQLRLAFEEVTGQDWNWFFNQWFLAAGHPELSVTDTFANGEIILKVVQNQDSIYSPIYKLPLYVDIWTQGKKERHHITIHHKEQEFRFKALQKPDLVFFDGETQLVGEVNHERSLEEYAFQYKNSDKYLARMEALTQLADKINEDESARAIVFLALGDVYWQIRQEAARTFERYSGETDKDKYINKLKEIVLKDKKSLVRAVAINALSALDNESSEIYLQTMKDSSYSVLTNSIYAYANTGGANVNEVIAQFEKIDNFLINKVVAEYYSYKNVEGKIDWFLEKMNAQSGGELMYLLEYFANYLGNQDADIQTQGANLLIDKAKNEPNAMARVSAYLALKRLEKVTGLKEILKEIRQGEKDKEALQYYDMIKE
jgi:aminopeptidase N